MNLHIKDSDIRDSLIYIFRYCLTRQSYAVSTGQDILYYNLEHFSEADIKLFIREIKEAEETYGDTVCPIDKSWLRTIDFLNEELRRRDVK